MGWNLFLFFCGRTTWVRPPDSETTVAVKESIDPYSEDFTNELDHLKRYETCSTSGWLGGWGEGVTPGLGIRSFQKNVLFFPFFSVLY